MMPDWILSRSRPEFVSLVERCPACAWVLLLIVAASWLYVLWIFARGYELSRQFPRPTLATRPRAVIGALWLVALVVVSWLSGLKGLIPLLGDAVLVSIAGIIWLEWYVWWELRPWIGKVVELTVIGTLWWLAWAIANVMPKTWAWPVTIFSFGATAYMMVLLLVSRPTLRKILLVNVMGPFIVAPLLIPRSLWPEVSIWVVVIGLALVFSWMLPFVGTVWMKLPEWVTGAAAPLWFISLELLSRFGTPYIKR